MFIKYVRYDSSSVLLDIIIVILDANIEHHERVQSSIAVKQRSLLENYLVTSLLM